MTWRHKTLFSTHIIVRRQTLQIDGNGHVLTEDLDDLTVDGLEKHPNWVRVAAPVTIDLTKKAEPTEPEPTEEAKPWPAPAEISEARSEGVDYEDVRKTLLLVVPDMKHNRGWDNMIAAYTELYEARHEQE